MAQAIGEIVQGLWDPEWFIEDKKSRHRNTTTPSRKEWKPWRDNGGECSKPRWGMRSDHVREDGASTIDSESSPTEKPQSTQIEQKGGIERFDHVREDGVNTIESESKPTKKPQSIQSKTVYKLQIQGPQWVERDGEEIEEIFVVQSERWSEEEYQQEDE